MRDMLLGHNRDILGHIRDILGHMRDMLLDIIAPTRMAGVRLWTYSQKCISYIDVFSKVYLIYIDMYMYICIHVYICIYIYMYIYITHTWQG